jgi:formylglycine-generating enzyme required for sulfatase activity
MTKKYAFSLGLSMLMLGHAFGNNIQVDRVTLTDYTPAEGYVRVSFDLSWENSWRSSSAPGNWDAAWVFIKFRTVGGDWQHARLHDSGHLSGSGTSATLEVGLLSDNLPYDAAANPGIGVVVYRATADAGAFRSTGMALRWNYAAHGISSSTDVEVQVFAVEMVLVPGGLFWVGDGVSTGTFHQADTLAPFPISAIGATLRCANTSYDDAQLTGAGIWVDGDGGISRTAATATDINADFPTGFRGFYCMKYEITQGQYRDFLNTLTRAQQNARTAADIAGTSVVNRYVMTNTDAITLRNGLRCGATLPADGPIEVYCDLDGDGIGNEDNDGEWIACNFISWADGLAYMDWCGLRPITELEYEKACRGPNAPLPNEYAWGTAGLSPFDYSLRNEGRADEGIMTNFSTSMGNAYYFQTNGGVDGLPTRVGIFAADPRNTGRISAGAGFYGAMELSGNLSERMVTVGRIEGRNFSGRHGDGALSSSGAADQTGWPGANALGAGFRAGCRNLGVDTLRVSDRSDAGLDNSSRAGYMGFRGGRSVQATGEGY